MEHCAAVNRTRPIGIEIECLVPVTERKSRHEVQQAIARILTANGIPSVARGYSSAPVPPGITCCVEFDESLSPPQMYKGMLFANLEVKTKKLAGLDEFDQIVSRLLDILKFLNCMTNGTTGTHVSLDVSHEMQKGHFLRSALNLFYRFEPLVYGLVAPHRRTCGYAGPMLDLRAFWRVASAAELRRLLNVWDRRCGLNIRHAIQPPYPGGQRIEFRWLEGTLRAEVIRNWVILLNRMLDHAVSHNCKTPKQQVANDRAGFDRLAIAVGFKSNSGAYQHVSEELVGTRRFLLRRWKRLNRA